MKLFQNVVQQIKLDIGLPFRGLSRQNITEDNIKSLVKTIPRFVCEKRKNYNKERQDLDRDGPDATDEEFKDCL